MPFCSKCGEQLADDSKFCPNCGTPVGTSTSGIPSQRKQVFEGEIRKCPNCGELLKSFEVICPVCGYELRGVKASTSVQKLSEQIAKVEQSRPDSPQKPKGLKGAFSANSQPKEADATDKKIATLIQSFPIPNSKEDIFEFILLAASNIDVSVLDPSWNSISMPNWASRNIVSEAWISKFEQSYEKAKLSFGNGPDFQQIEAIHTKKNKEIRKGRKKTLRFLITYFGGMFGLAAIFGVIGSILELIG